MKLVRYLENVKLLKTEKVKQNNGTYINDYTEIDNYKVQAQRLSDEISATIYGANINKMYKITSPLKDLENFLVSKVNNKQDNISLYFIEYKNSKYKVVSATEEMIEIELL